MPIGAARAINHSLRRDETIEILTDTFSSRSLAAFVRTRKTFFDRFLRRFLLNKHKLRPTDLPLIQPVVFLCVTHAVSVLLFVVVQLGKQSGHFPPQKLIFLCAARRRRPQSRPFTRLFMILV